MRRELLWIPLGQDKGIQVERAKVIGKKFGYHFSKTFRYHRVWFFGFVLSWKFKA